MINIQTKLVVRLKKHVAKLFQYLLRLKVKYDVAIPFSIVFDFAILIFLKSNCPPYIV